MKARMAQAVKGSAIVEPTKRWHEDGKGATPCHVASLRAQQAQSSANKYMWARGTAFGVNGSCQLLLLAARASCTALLLGADSTWRAGYEIMERILKPLVGVFDDVMQELHDSRVPDVGREEEDAFMSKAVQYIRQYILSDRVTMR